MGQEPLFCSSQLLRNSVKYWNIKERWYEIG